MMVTEDTFWKTYGKYLVLGALVLLLGFGVYQFRVHQRNTQTEQASLLYDKMYESLRNQKIETSKEEATQLVAQYPKTPYASLAALFLARLEIEQNNKDKAIEYLELAMKLAEKEPVLHIARVRLARVLASKAQYDQALKLLESHSIAGYIPLYEEAKGDIYVMQNNLDKAREAYAAASQAVPMGVNTMSLQLKQNDLNNKEDS